MVTAVHTLSSFKTRAFAGVVGVCLMLSLAACGDDGKGQVKAIKEEVQRAYGKKDFQKIISQAQKGLALAREHQGEKSPDTLYFAQAISEANMGMHNVRGAMSALRQEINLRADAGQSEKKLQIRRTMLIQLAEENGDRMTAADQAVMVAKGIDMGPGKDPQPVYRPMPDYPPEQYRQKVEGDVEISYDLDASGSVVGARVKKSTPAHVFDEAALENFRKWRFTPMLDRTGQPVSGSGFTFTLAFRMGK